MGPLGRSLKPLVRLLIPIAIATMIVIIGPILMLAQGTPAWAAPEGNKDTLQTPVEIYTPTTELPQGYIIIEGDIQVPSDFFNHTRDGPNATFITTNFWPNGVVPYEFDANVTPANRTAMQTAMNDWQAAANVSFNQCANNTCALGTDYIHIQNSATSNNSAVGRQGGMQVINIFNWNFEFIMAHELGHALGYWHEQSAPDRDTFIQVNYGNVSQTACQGSCNSQFDIRNNAGVYGPYDFDSVMHYSQCAFSINSTCPTGGGQTITVLPPNQQWQTLIGQRTHLSTMDRLTMSFLYPQPNWRFLGGNQYGGMLGTFLGPYTDLSRAVNGTPAGGTLWIQPGTYSALGTYNQPMTWQAPLGAVILGQ